MTGLVGLEKTILGQTFGGMAVAQGGQRKAKDLQPVEAHYGLEVVQLTRTLHRGCHPSNRSNRLHLETV
jgi:hypothetical protein